MSPSLSCFPAAVPAEVGDSLFPSPPRHPPAGSQVLPGDGPAKPIHGQA